MQLSEHFSLEEFTRSDAATRLGIANTPTKAHLANLRITAAGLEEVRALFNGARITLLSGYRNPPVNAAVGGVKTSAHALGWAGDITIEGYGPRGAGRIIAASEIKFDQLIHEVSRHILHISFDPRLRRQVLTQALGPGTPVTVGI